ncbi:MAG TPA: D-alanyl-D-alanine carboxypeptidase family protein [Spirochaetia bacterium]|nr:D-alanyl-D-alanine carboxypeptidase family protein [Spirochaetia bacterium]
MFFLRKFTAALAVAFFLFTLLSSPVGVRADQATPAPLPDPVAKSAILIDDTNGQVLWSKDPDEHLYPASTTKILTALIAIQKGNLDDAVTIPKDAVGVEGSSIGLQLGETFTLKNLLYALLLASSNDSAVAIADDIGGSVPAFVQMMNEEAQQLGAVNSHFANPHGLFDPNHYVTAADLAIIARAAMQNPVFREIVDTRSYTLPPRTDPKAQVDLVNHNRMLWTYPGCVGVKPGYVVKSGETLVAAADRNGRELIAVVLDSSPTGLFSDAASMLDYGFNAFARQEVVAPDQVLTRMPVRFGTVGVDLVASQPVYYDFPVNVAPDVDRQVEVNEALVAPIRQGQQVGVVRLTWQGQNIGWVPVVAKQTVNRLLYADWFFWLILVLVAASGAWFYAWRGLARRGKVYRLRRR